MTDAKPDDLLHVLRRRRAWLDLAKIPGPPREIATLARQLERDGLAETRRIARGRQIRLTPAGKKAARLRYEEYTLALENILGPLDDLYDQLEL